MQKIFAFLIRFSRQNLTQFCQTYSDQMMLSVHKTNLQGRFFTCFMGHSMLGF
jgi:hypothetical protein